MRFTRWGKSLVERSLGVTISRLPSTPPNQHSDRALRRLRPWSSQDVVFDVGANDGRTILRIQDQLSSPRIFAFEPVSATHRKLVERTSHLENVQCFQLALGERPGRQAIHLNEIDAMSSFSPKWGNSAGTEMVEITTIDRFMAEHEVDFIHYLKIDTEGYELEVLKGAQEALAASRIAILQVEVGFDQTEHDFVSLEQARRHLAPLGYLLYGIFNQCSRKARIPEFWTAGQLARDAAEALVYCDALFIRAEM